MINNQVILTDISFYQDDNSTPYKVDFRAMRAGGVDGTIIRAGQNQWIDEDFRDYVHNAILASHPWGAYWFYDSRVPPEAQAAKLQEAMSGLPKPPLGIWADYEDVYDGAWGGGAHFKVFIEELKNRFPTTLIGIYTAPYYWIDNTKPEQRDWFKQFPLWIAHYQVANPTIPYPWEKFVLWQYTSKGDGKKLGAESFGLDMDLFSGTFDDYKRYFLLGDISPVEPPPQGEFGMFKVYSDKYKMSLRKTNEVTGVFIEYIPIGTIMKADKIEPQLSGGMGGDKWAHIIDAGGVTKDGWVAVIHNGVVYCQYEQIPTSGSHVVEVYVDGILEYKKEF
jgi:lysozyme